MGEMRKLTFGVGIAGIEWNSIFVCNSGVECTLHLVDGLWDEVEAEKAVRVEVIKQSYLDVSIRIKSFIAWRRKSYHGNQILHMRD